MRIGWLLGLWCAWTAAAAPVPQAAVRIEAVPAARAVAGRAPDAAPAQSPAPAQPAFSIAGYAIQPPGDFHGGEVVCAGPIPDIFNQRQSTTIKYLTGEYAIVTPQVRRPVDPANNRSPS